jgi:tRNA pseudouridine13 synthase
VLPTIPERSLTHISAVGGQLGPDPEDFRVTEIPAYEFCGEGEHLYVRMRKRSRTTRDLIRAVSLVTGIRDREIGSAGMKDKHAVTEQWLSMPARDAGDAMAWELPDWCSVLEVARHSNKLRTGHLRGNRFEVRLVGVETGETADGNIAAVCETMANDGYLNIFDAQRFGYGGRNLDEAVAWLDGRRVKDRRLRKLLASAIQSEIFNRYAVARAELGLKQLIEGEVVRLEGSSGVFVVEDLSAEQLRLANGDVHLTGPIHGPKMRVAAGGAAIMEDEAAGAFPADTLEKLAREAPGTRRDLLVRPLDIEWKRQDGGDEGVVVLSFFLPSGAYATRVIAEITGGAVERETS